MQNMGLGKISSYEVCFKRKYRYLFFIPNISDDGVNALPPLKSSRPSLSFKEIDAQHITETIYYPGRPEWKPISLVLYDLKQNKNPVWEWIKESYDPTKESGGWNPSCSSNNQTSFKRGIGINSCKLEMYDGVGSVIEKWIFEGVWCQNIEFGDLDMGSSEVSTIDITLRYDRAYIE
jgi:hypothetical protein